MGAEASKGTREAPTAAKGTRGSSDARGGSRRAPITYAMLTYGDDDYAEGQAIYSISKGTR